MDNPPCVFLSPPFTPHRAHRARGCSGDMQLDCKATAARRRASRLAGLVCFPVWRLIQTAIRRWASWLAPPHPLAAGLPKSANHQNPIPPQGVNLPTANSGKQKPHKGYACLPPAVGKQKPSLLGAAKPSICKKLSHPARGKPAHRQLRRTEAPQGLCLSASSCGEAEAFITWRG